MRRGGGLVARAAVPRAAPHRSRSSGLVGGRDRTPVPARRASPITACCSSTSSPSSRAPRWRRCASRWRTARSRSCAASARRCSRRGSCSSRRRTRVRAVRGTPACRVHDRRPQPPPPTAQRAAARPHRPARRRGAPVRAGPDRAPGRRPPTRSARRCVAARERQAARLAGTGTGCNADMPHAIGAERVRPPTGGQGGAARRVRQRRAERPRARPRAARRAHHRRSGGQRRDRGSARAGGDRAAAIARARAQGGAA